MAHITQIGLYEFQRKFAEITKNPETSTLSIWAAPVHSIDPILDLRSMKGTPLQYENEIKQTRKYEDWIKCKEETAPLSEEIDTLSEEIGSFSGVAKTMLKKGLNDKNSENIETLLNTMNTFLEQSNTISMTFDSTRTEKSRELLKTISLLSKHSEALSGKLSLMIPPFLEKMIKLSEKIIGISDKKDISLGNFKRNWGPILRENNQFNLKEQPIYGTLFHPGDFLNIPSEQANTLPKHQREKLKEFLTAIDKEINAIGINAFYAVTDIEGGGEKEQKRHYIFVPNAKLVKVKPNDPESPTMMETNLQSRRLMLAYLLHKGLVQRSDPAIDKTVPLYLRNQVNIAKAWQYIDPESDKAKNIIDIAGLLKEAIKTGKLVQEFDVHAFPKFNQWEKPQPQNTLTI